MICKPASSCAWAILAGLATLSHAQSAETIGAALEKVTVIASSPVGSTGISIDKFPGNVQRWGADALNPDAGNLAARLDQSLGSVHLNDTQGNPFQMDINYRGFTASPILGTPQGLSVYLDGMRVNESFGDIVAWDLLPQLAIDKLTLIPGSNPMYGLNTLGGAIAMSTKTGLRAEGSQARFTVGSFGRRSVDLEHGRHSEDDSLYLAATVYTDDGWAANNPSTVRQVFSKWLNSGPLWDIAISLQYADNLLFGNQTVPLSMLDQAAQGYSHPDHVSAQSLGLNLSGNQAVDASNSFGGNAYIRTVSREILNSNIHQLLSSSTNNSDCVADLSCPAANLVAAYQQRIVGSNAQWTNTEPLLAMGQALTQITAVGLNAEFSDTTFTNQGQHATLDASNGLVGTGPFLQQADVRSRNQRWGVFASSTVDATDRLSVTLSARYDLASIKLEGNSCIDEALCDAAASIASGQLADVGGEHQYQRLNPALGLTYLLAPHWIGFANYAEGFRTPSAIELACADPAAPCSGIPNAFGADPYLAAVVSRTIEVGMRGSFSKRLRWRTAYYRSVLDNDILFNQSSLNTGYFSNVGRTQRQGVEVGLDGSVGVLDYAVDLDWIDATYQSGFALANPSNSAFGTPVVAGNKIPGVPPWVLKANLHYQLVAGTKVGLAMQAQGPQYARGDENNADVGGPVPGFVTFKLDLNHSLGKASNLSFGINNLLDARYANYGAVAENNITTGAAEQFRAQGAPRSLWLALGLRF